LKRKRLPYLVLEPRRKEAGPMASTTLTTPIRRRLSTFARGIARPFTDSRRRNFITDMLTGLVVAGHVHLTAVARGINNGAGNIHAIEKRLSRNLKSEHWEADPIADALLRRSAALVTDDTLIVGDTTDLAKYHAQHLEGLGRVHDGSDPDGRIAPGYCVFEAYVRVGAWQLFPLVIEPLKVYAGAATGENAELLRHILRAHAATGRKGAWVLDRGFDRRELYGPLVNNAVAFVVRQRGDRTVRTADGRDVTIEALVAEQVCPRPKPWPSGGVSVTAEVRLPEVSADAFLLVIGWRVPGSERPLVLLVSPAARRSGRTGKWFVRAYHKRWGVEDATRGLKQQFRVEQFLVRTWRALRRLLWLVAWSFWWLNLWGEERFAPLREALMSHPWRLKKGVTYLFDWIAAMLRKLLHPRPKVTNNTG
jgi:Transposase DDE domain